MTGRPRRPFTQLMVVITFGHFFNSFKLDAMTANDEEP